MAILRLVIVAKAHPTKYKIIKNVKGTIVYNIYIIPITGINMNIIFLGSVFFIMKLPIELLVMLIKKQKIKKKLKRLKFSCPNLLSKNGKKV